MGPIPAVIGLVLSAVGTGLSYSAQMSAANTSSTFSLLNAQAGAQQASQQGALGALQAQLQATQADTAARAAGESADAMRAQTEMEAKISQENTRKNRDEFTRQLAAVTAAQGASGATFATGSPLDYLVTAADQEAQTEQEQQYQINAGRVAGYRGAAEVGLGGKAQGLNSSLYQLQSLAAIEEGRFGAIQSRLGGLAGQAQAGGMRSSAFGGLIGGLAQSATGFAATGFAATRYQPKLRYSAGAGGG